MTAAPLSPTHILAQQLIDGSADFLEAGDCRRPGIPEALRAVFSGDAAMPLCISGASLSAPLSEMTKYTLDQGIAKLSKHALGMSQSVGPAARVFTVKLRKRP